MSKPVKILFALVLTAALLSGCTPGHNDAVEKRASEDQGVAAPPSSEFAGNVVKIQDRNPSAEEVAAACDPEPVEEIAPIDGWDATWVVCASDDPAQLPSR